MKGGRASKAKGTRWESEFCAIATEFGIPTLRVLGSGAFVGAKGDVKIDVPLNPDGSLPEADEAKCTMRGELKNRRTNPEKPYEALEALGMALSTLDKAPELPWKDLEQSDIPKVVLWRRAKVPKGAIKNKDYNKVFLAVMGGKDFLDLLKELKYLRGLCDRRG